MGIQKCNSGILVGGLPDAPQADSLDMHTSQKMARMIALPSELIDSIIDFLHDDREALANCSLTCRSWLPRTRYHKFSTMIVTEDVKEKYSQFLDDCPDVRPYFRILRLNAFGTNPSWNDWNVMSFVTRLPNIYTLVFRGLSFHSAPPLGPDIRLRELMFHNCFFQSLDILLSTLASIGSVDMLSLQATILREASLPSGARMQRYAPSYRLTGLDLFMVLPRRTYAILCALLDASFYDHVELLGIGLSMHDVDFKVSRRILSTMSSVRMLRVYGQQGLFEYHPSNSAPAPLDLSQFPNLRVLAFGSRGHAFALKPDAEANFMTPIATALSQIVSPHVEEIQLFPQWLGFPMNIPLEWMNIMKMLVSDRFPRLKRIAVVAIDRIAITAQIMSALTDMVISDPKSHGIPRITITMKLLTLRGEQVLLYPVVGTSS